MDRTLLDQAKLEWDAGRPLEAGGLIYEHLQPNERPGWAASALKLACPHFPMAPEVETALQLVNERPRWREAHAAFQAVRRLTLQVERGATSEPIDPRRYAFLLLAENTAKVTYNASGAPCPFDLISGARVASHLHRLVDLLDDPNLRREAWDVISRGAACPHWDYLRESMRQDQAAILNDPSARDSDGATSFMHAAAVGCSAILRESLARGADVNATDARGAHALIYAVKSGDPVMIYLLTKTGAEVNRQTESGETAMMAAAAFGIFAVVEALLQSGADWRITDNHGGSALSRAEQLDDPEIAQLFIGIEAGG